MHRASRQTRFYLVGDGLVGRYILLKDARETESRIGLKSE